MIWWCMVVNHVFGISHFNNCICKLFFIGKPFRLLLAYSGPLAQLAFPLCAVSSTDGPMVGLVPKTNTTEHHGVLSTGSRTQYR